MRLSEIKTVLRERKLHLSKKLGQHLLIDANALAKIVETADLAGNDLVVEIGAGTGLLTEAVGRQAGYTVAVEVDRGFSAYLREKFAENEKVSIVHEDILKCDLSHLCYQAVRKSQLKELRRIKAMGNLPFNINAPIVMKLAEARMPLDLCVFLVQKEVAERYAATPGGKLYGAITVFLQYRFEVERVFSIGRECFFPQPEVDSVVIRMRPRQTSPIELVDEELFFRIVRGAFNQRRKMLKNSLRHVEGFESREDDISAAFRISGISPETRPERVSLEQFGRLANALADLDRSRQVRGNGSEALF